MTSSAELLFELSPATSGELLFGDSGAAPPAPPPEPVEGAALLFELPPATDGRLLFGEEYVPPDEPVEATLDATFAPLLVDAVGLVGIVGDIDGSFPPLVVDAVGLVSVDAYLDGTFAPLVVEVEGRYESNTARPTVGQTEAHWQEADANDTPGTMSRFQDSTSAPALVVGAWQQAAGVEGFFAHPLPSALLAAPVPRMGRFQQATPLPTATGQRYQDSTRTHQWRADWWQPATPVRSATGFRHQDATRTHQSRAAFYEAAAGLARSIGDTFHPANALLMSWLAQYQDGVPPPPGISTLPPEPPGPTPCYTPNAALLFQYQWEAGAGLLFQCDAGLPPVPGETVIVPIRKVYFVINTMLLRRASDDAPVPAFSIGLQIDFQSWTWGFNASVPAAARSLVSSVTGPVELLADINGTTYRVLAESVASERIFGRESLRISGRGFSAMLAAPYAPLQTFGNTITRTAQQLMDDVLTENGVSLGWGVDWGLTDWQVPAGVFSHQGSYMTALQAIAGAAGGYLLPHPNLPTLRVRHNYPVAPWAWADVVPNFVLPADVATKEAIENRSLPNYNRIFVSGQKGGILGQVTRAGTAGDLLAPMVVDPLITQADAARQRAIAILGNTGRQAGVTLRLPVLSDTGVIEPGAFVRYDDESVQRLGIVRSTSVEASGLDSVWQSIQLEVHA